PTSACRRWIRNMTAPCCAAARRCWPTSAACSTRAASSPRPASARPVPTSSNAPSWSADGVCAAPDPAACRPYTRGVGTDRFDAQALQESLALPAECYVGEEAARRDRERVFACSWQLVGRAEQLRAPGDHVVCEIAGVPLLLVRGEDGVPRALHNVCRHRAGPLATCDGRGAKRLRCRYHGWSYRLDGRLEKAVEMDAAEGFDPAA